MIGAQRPRVVSLPPYRAADTGDEAVALVLAAGIDLDDWQQFVLRESLRERPDGRWAARSVGLCIPRQNGKTELIVARQLVGLFLLNEPLQLHSAHQFGTALEAFRRLVEVIEANAWLKAQVKLNRGRVGREGNGKEGIELKNGCRIQYKARSGGNGRGFTCDTLYLDEAMILADTFMGGVFSSLSAVPNAQIWYAGSAGNEADATHDAIVFARIRERALKGDDDSLAWFEWSVDRDAYLKDPSIANDPAFWAQANPAFGTRITEDFISEERTTLREENFCIERLGIGNWPRTDGSVDRLIQPVEWEACLDRESRMQPGTMVLAFDSTPDHAFGCVAVAGKRSDGLDHVEVVRYERDTTWIPQLLANLKQRYGIRTILLDSAGPATALLPELVRLNLEFVPVSRQELRQGCGMVFDGIKNQTLRHGGQDPLDKAIDGVGITGSDAWVWSRKGSDNDICPLYAVTLALWGLHTQQEAPVGVINLNDIAAKQEEQKPEVVGFGPFNQRTVPMSEALGL